MVCSAGHGGDGWSGWSGPGGLRRWFCDGAGLFASVLERIGIEAEIVFIPGHAFIGYRTWSNSDTWEFVETTLAWNGGTFAQAISQGNSTYNAQLPNINSGVSHVLKISAARSQGYTPYPYDLAF